METMKSSTWWFVWLALVLALSRGAHCNSLDSSKNGGQKEGVASIEDEPSGGDKPSELEGVDKKERGADKSSQDDDDLAAQDTDEKDDQDNDNDEASAASASEGSRAVGGEPVAPPSWLVSSWYPGDMEDKKNKFAGHMIRLNDNLVLGHEFTCNGPQVEWGGRRYGEQVTLRAPSKINTRTGSTGTSRSIGCGLVEGNKLAQDFGVHQLRKEKGTESLLDLTSENHFKGPPVLQHDPNVKDKCFLHAYSGNKDPTSPEPDDDHTFSRFSVRHGGCTDGVCTFHSNNHRLFPHGSVKAGSVCPHNYDRGAPILCGQDQKLSFLVSHQPSSECGDTFHTLSIADHHEKIMDIVKHAPLPERTKPEKDDANIMRHIFAPGPKVW